MRNVIMRMERITKTFGPVIALNNVDIELFEGETLALVGENGAGKSTLMKILSGDYASSSYAGDIELDGRKVHFRSTHDAEREGIEMIYQEISLIPHLSVAENIFLGNLPRKRIPCFVSMKTARQLSREALSYVGLNVGPDQAVNALSTSQQQLISIAKALYRKPKILVLDEPTSALTETETQNLKNIIKSLKQRNISCIYISHKLAEVFDIADRVMILRDGKVISTYNKQEIVPEKVIEDIVGRKIDKMYPKVNARIGKEVLRIESFTVPSKISSKNIVENISFSVNAGEILGLGGLVGSGRSELVNAIFGSKDKSSGRIFIAGKEVTLNGPLDAIGNGLALLTEDRRISGFVPTMNIRENISLASFKTIFRRMLVRRSLEQEHVKRYSKLLNIRAPSVETNIMKLSGGNQQKVVLAKWLMTGPKVLFLDEPTRGIDVGSKVEIYGIMSDLVASGVAIVMISSELPELIAMSDRLIILAAGKIGGEFAKGELTQENLMKVAAGIQ
jgi:ABC-type sugar transport system ATPase subunit